MPENILTVVQKSDHSVGFYSIEEGEELTRLPLGRYPHESALSPDGKTICVSEYGVQSSSSTAAGGDTVAVVDVAAREVVASISCGGMCRPHGIVFDFAGTLYVLSEGADHLLIKRNPRAGGSFDSALKTGGKKGHMLAVKRDGSRAFFMNIASGNVTTLDLLNANSRPVVVYECEWPEGFCFSDDESFLFVANRGGADIAVIDTQTLKPVRAIKSRKTPLRMATGKNGRIICVHFSDDFTASVINPETGEEEIALAQPSPVICAALDRAKERAVFSLQNDTVRVYDANSWKFREFPARAEPDSAIFVAD